MVRLSTDQTQSGGQHGIVKKGKRQITELRTNLQLIYLIRIYKELLKVNNSKLLSPHPPVTPSTGVWTASSDKEETAGAGLVTDHEGDLTSPSPSLAAPWDEEHVSLANNQCGPEATAMDASLEANPTPKSCKESDMAEHKHTHTQGH